MLFFLDPAVERWESMARFATSISLDARKYIRSSDPTRHTISALIDWINDLHGLIYSLDGDVNGSDFAVTHRACLKGEQYLIQKVINTDTGDKRGTDRNFVVVIN